MPLALDLAIELEGIAFNRPIEGGEVDILDDAEGRIGGVDVRGHVVEILRRADVDKGGDVQGRKDLPAVGIRDGKHIDVVFLRGVEPMDLKGEFAG